MADEFKFYGIVGITDDNLRVVDVYAGGDDYWLRPRSEPLYTIVIYDDFNGVNRNKRDHKQEDALAARIADALQDK